MLYKNPEIKAFLIKYLIGIVISIFIIIMSTNLILNEIKESVIENNQIIIGTVINKYPYLEKDLVGIITQGKNKDKLTLGKKILEKYSYNKYLDKESIIENSKEKIYTLNLIAIISIIILLSTLIINILLKIYREISDMTNYVYYSSEQKDYSFKNKNQEGQIGLLKTELIKMNNILNENIKFINDEKILLSNALSDISHQLKTPMTSLFILNDLMYNDLEKNIKNDFLDKTKSQLNRMKWLIESMLKLSKIDAKVIDFKREDVCIKELIYKSIEPSKMDIDAKNIDLKIIGSDEKFIGDMNWSVEAIVNIIKNCVEHTDKNGIIEIFFSENPMFSEIIIKDNGEGIDKKDLANILKRFYKGKNSKEDSVGIGLAMAKSIIEEQGGNIFVDSKKGVGTEFHITMYKNYCD